MTVNLGEGKLGEVWHKPCELDSGRKYKFGHVNYRCSRQGWVMDGSTCHNWVCPAQTAEVTMQYASEGGTITGKAEIELRAAMTGPLGRACPEGSLDPSGTITFNCLSDGSWQIGEVRCGNGVQVRQAGPDSGSSS